MPPPAQRPPQTSRAMDRRRQILDGAGRVLLQLGYHKASVEEVAHEAGISRQGVYLHFGSKEELFSATITYLLETSVSTARTALNEVDMNLEDRLLKAFAALTRGQMVTGIDEIFAAAEQLTARPPAELEGRIVTEFATALSTTPLDSGWRRHGDSAVQVAGLLYSTSLGLKRTAASLPEYLDSLQRIVQFICRP